MNEQEISLLHAIMQENYYYNQSITQPMIMNTYMTKHQCYPDSPICNQRYWFV